VWLGLTVGFAAAGFGVWQRKRWAIALAGVLALVSFVVCIAGLPETAAGVASNLAIVASAGYFAFRQSRSLELKA